MPASLEETAACLAEDEVVRLVRGELSIDARTRALAHVESCSLCVALVGRIAARATPAPVAADDDTVASGPGDDTPKESPGPRASTELDTIRRGTAIGRYLVLAPLGMGGMGVVVSAHDPELDRKVAIKLLRPRGAFVDELARARLQREAQAMARLSDPHVVAVHDVGMHAGQVFIAMEFVEGETLGAWLRAQPPWRAVIDAFLQAGRGLAAAHGAGLVHRDFKPDNVLRDRDGRVRVMDFGLAAPSDRDIEHTDEGVVDDGMGRAAGLSEKLTATGAVLGTPLYMAPEQHLGRATDARTDQFSFCVALYDALFRVRPFEGDSFPALSMSVTEGKLRVPPRVPGLPARIRRAVMRGLSTAPEQRFATMTELLAELAPDRDARRRLWIAGGATVAVSIAALALAWPRPDAPCTGSDTAIAEVWNDARADGIAAAFDGTGLAFADAAALGVRTGLDAYAQEWITMRKEACEATLVRHEQSDRAMDLRMACLDRRRAELDVLANELGSPSADAVQRSVDAVGALTPLAGCADLEALGAVVPLPDDPRDRAALGEVDRMIVEAKTAVDLGQYARARARAEEALERARSLDHAPAIAGALHLLGRAESRTGELASAETHLHEAVTMAAVAKHDRLAAQAWTELAYVVGYLRAEHARGLDWGRAAESAIVRAGSDPLLVARQREAVAVVHERRGESKLAEPLLREALAIYETELGPDALGLAPSLDNLAANRFDQGDLDDAQALYRRAASIREATLGDDHPDVALALSNLARIDAAAGRWSEAEAGYLESIARYERALPRDHLHLADPWNDLGIVYEAVGRYGDAVRAHERALAIREGALGRRHPDVADSLSNLGNVLDATGERQRALELYERGLAIREAAQGPEHPNVAGALDNIAGVHAELGHFAEAEPLFRRAVAIREATLGPEHPKLAQTLANLAGLLEAKGDLVGAIELHERALAIREASLGAEHPDVGASLVSIADIRRAQGEHVDAHPMFERGLANLEAAYPGGGPYTAWARFAFAQSLWDSRVDRARARTLAARARAEYSADGEGSRDALADVDAWISRHGR